MPSWPSLGLFLVSIANCKPIVASFRVGTTPCLATSASVATARTCCGKGTMTRRLSRSIFREHRGARRRQRLGMVGSGGMNDGYHNSRKGIPAVQAVADVEQPVAAVPTLEDELGLANLDSGDYDPGEITGDRDPNLGGTPPSQPPLIPSIEDGVKMELGKYKAEPFEEGSFPAQYLYALQRLRSEEDESFGAAFLSLRAANDRASTRTWSIGRPNATGMLSLARFKLWWMMPKHTTKANEIPPETQMMLTQLPPDPDTGRQLYGIFIPLIDGQAKCSLKGLPDRRLQLFAETGCTKTAVPSSDVAGLYVGVHEDPFKLVEKSFKLVNARLRNQVRAGSFGAGGLVPGLVHDAEKQLSRWKKSEVISKSVDKTSPDFSNYLGWCTWDSFYTSVDHDKVFKGLESLRSAGIRPKWLVLDDGWQSTTNSAAANGEQWMDHLTSLMANNKFKDEKKGFDLARTVKKAREEFGVNYFLVWHAIAGYWAGVDLDAPDLAKYKPRRASLNAPPGIVEVDPDMKMFFRVSKFLNKRFGVVPPEKIKAFYDDYHRYLESQGVDGVKVDAQSVVNFLGPDNGGSVMLTRAFHSALSKSVRKHFPDSDGEFGEGGRIIHCMCHDSEILLQLPACYGRQPVIRGSDDFYPRDRASHAPHIYANAFNGLLISSVGLQDWDMFQTNIGEASWMHAAARAVSGGPVYISDRPGEHNVDILRRMVLEDGGVLKPPANALPCLNSLFVDAQRQPDALLSIWNECDAGGHGVVAIFNLFGSAWSQGRRTYAPVRTPSGALYGLGEGENKNGGVAERVKGGIKPSDCHRLLRDHLEQQEHLRAIKGRGRGADASTTAALNGQAGAGRDSPRYAVHLHFGNRLLVGGLHEAHTLELERAGSEVAAISKVMSIDAPAARGEWASIGLADMFNAGGAIVSEAIVKTAAGGTNGAAGGQAAAELMVKGSGRFLAYCSLRPAEVLFEGQAVEFTHGQTNDGVAFLEVLLPGGFTGQPRKLVVQWDLSSRAVEGSARVDLSSAGRSHR